MSAAVLEKYIVRRSYLCDVLSVFANITVLKSDSESQLVEMRIVVTMYTLDR